MMKKKLFLFVISLIIGVIGGGKIFAQGWTASEVAAGNFYLYNVGANAYLTNGACWGTHAAFSNNGFQVNLTKVSDGVYTIGTNSKYSGKFFTDNGYVDTASSTNWTFEVVDATAKTYKLKAPNGKYAYATTGLYNIMIGDDTGDNRSVWKLVTDNDRNDYTVASSSNPLNISHKIKNPRFDDNTSNWTGGGDRGGKTDGKNENGEASFNEKNPCVEWYHKVTNFYQTISELPVGKYRVKCQGFYRADDGSADASYLYANDQKTALSLINAHGEGTGESMGGASTSFSAGLYWNTCDVNVTTGTLTIAIKTDDTHNWTIWDNFQLECLGTDLSTLQSIFTEIKTEATELLSDASYNIVTGLERSNLFTQSTATAAEETVEAYQTAISAVQTAIDAFKNSKPNYELLEIEKTKASDLGMTNEAIATVTPNTTTGLQALKDLKVAEYNYVTTTYQYGVALGAWTSTGENTKAATFSNEHWSGASHDYMNQYDNDGQGWNHDGWSIDFNQDVTLPAGNYVFKVAGRQAPGDAVTTSLIVKQGSTILGTVSDFPRGNSARGINKSGATSFDEESDKYARDGNGYGWEWRYVKFTLAADATVNIAINSVATAKYQWVSFGDYTLQTDNEANISLIAYNIALNNAQTLLADATYTNVGGTDRSNLETDISNDATLDKTSKDDIDAAKNNLETHTTAFTAGVAKWNAYALAKEYGEAINATLLPYADEAKLAAVATELAKATSTAADAETNAASINTKNRIAYESNALAEGVDGAEAIVIYDPNMDVTYNSETHKFGAWQVIGQTNGNIQLLSGESFTDGDGKHDYKYADIYKNDNNAGIQQTVNLEAGTYILTVTARAKNTDGAAFWVFAGDKKQNIERIGSSGGVFDRGWNDCTLEFEVPEKSDVNIGVQSGNGKDLWWSATRFRLMKIKEGANMKITDAKWATFVAPFDVTIPDGVTAYTITGVSGTSLVKEVVETTIPANKPVLLNSESEVNQTFYGKAIAGTPTNGLLTGVYVDNTPATVGTYVLEKHDTAVNFYKVEGAGIVINANRAYLTVPASVKMFSLDEDEEPTAIEGIDIAAEEYDAIYTPTGVKVESLQKGLNIVVKGEKSYKIFVK